MLYRLLGGLALSGPVISALISWLSYKPHSGFPTKHQVLLTNESRMNGLSLNTCNKGPEDAIFPYFIEQGAFTELYKSIACSMCDLDSLYRSSNKKVVRNGDGQALLRTARQLCSYTW